MDILLLIECLMSNTWMVLTGIEYPGTGVSVAAVLVGVFLICFVIMILRKILGGSK